jgi:phosphocarrier protein HPr
MFVSELVTQDTSGAGPPRARQRAASPGGDPGNTQIAIRFFPSGIPISPHCRVPAQSAKVMLYEVVGAFEGVVAMPQSRHSRKHAASRSATSALAPGDRISRDFIVGARYGLHLRPAALLVQTASGFESTISIQHQSARADARSLLGIMMLQASHGAIVTITAKGHDAALALDAISALFNRNFDEGIGLPALDGAVDTTARLKAPIEHTV